MSTVLKIAGVALLTAISALIIRQINPTAARLTAVAGITVMLVFTAREMQIFFAGLTEQLDISSLGIYGTRMLKALGIGIIVKAATEICRSCGEETAAVGIEIAGKLEILILCLPTAFELISLVTEIMP